MYRDTSTKEYDDFVNGIKRLPSLEEKAKAIQEALAPIANRYYRGAPSEIKVPKHEMAALWVLVVNNLNWKET